MTTGPPPERLPRRLHQSGARRIADRFVAGLADLGLVPYGYVLTTRGRRTGQLRRIPVTLIEHGRRRWLVAPYGPVSWVHNARAADMVTLRRGAEVMAYGLRELDYDEAGPILKEYVGIAAAVRPYFYATRDSPVGAFTAEAHLHPVFELLPR